MARIVSRIGYFIHGRGRGHATRSVPIVQRLRDAGLSVELFAGGDALRVLSSLDCTPIETIRPGPLALARTLQRVPWCRTALRRRAIRLLITDGESPSLLAAHSLGIPAVAVGHGLVFRHAQLAGIPLATRIVEAVNAASSSALAARKIVVHFLPTKPLDARTTIARADMADLPMCAEPSAILPTQPLQATCYFRDHNGGALLRALAATGAQVTSFGGKDELIAGVKHYPADRQRFLAALSRADAVVGSSGSNLLGEAIALGKPVLAGYRRGDREQKMNAMMVEAAQLGMQCGIESPDAAIVQEFCQRVRSGQFERFDLLRALPPVSQCVLDTVNHLLAA